MTMDRDVDLYGNELFRAGEMAPAGRYRLVDTTLTIELGHDGVLPGLQNGSASCFVRVHFWGDSGSGAKATYSPRSAGDGDALGQ